jgi:hypothetical protein
MKQVPIVFAVNWVTSKMMPCDWAFGRHVTLQILMCDVMIHTRRVLPSNGEMCYFRNLITNPFKDLILLSVL